jgi:hypothetical protein
MFAHSGGDASASWVSGNHVAAVTEMGAWAGQVGLDVASAQQLVIVFRDEGLARCIQAELLAFCSSEVRRIGNRYHQPPQ